MHLKQPSTSTVASDEPQTLEEAEAILRQMASNIALEHSNLAALAAELERATFHPVFTLPEPSPSHWNSDQYTWSERTFQSLVEAAPDALVIIDSDATIVLVNHQTERLFGYRRDELLGQKIEILVPERFRGKHVADRNRYFTNPSLRPMGRGLELAGRRKDGVNFPVEISLSPLETEERLLVTATVRDISDRKRLEARYRTLVEGIPAVTFMAALDEGNNEFYVSPQIEQLLGFSQQEWLGDPFLWYRQLHPDDRERWGMEFARTCASGVQFRSEYRFLSRDNRVVWVHGEAQIVRNDLGQPMFLQGIAFDITESKRAEETLRRSAEMLEQKVRERTVELEDATMRAELANRSRASFLANMSHEIRTPLNGIIGFADLLRRGADTTESERSEWLEIIHGGGKHLLALINDILDLSKIDAGKITIENVDCSPVKLIEEVCSILRSKASEKGLLLSAKFVGPMPTIIHSDPTRLRQVLMNVTGNAIKFTHTGTVTITAWTDIPAAGEPRLVVEIADTGIGIASDKLQSIFDPFTQADSSITRQFGGTGLGLAISQRLAEALGGGISVKSELGRGTTFRCDFATGPMDDAAFVEVGSPDLPRFETPAPTPITHKLHHRVLVVDDGETNRRLIELILGRAGARVEHAENGLQAVSRASREPFDVILMDMQMPIMDGYTATRELRSQGITVPIIALTANAMKGDEEICREAGCTGYLSKPLDQEQLFRAVVEAVGGQPSVAPTVPPSSSSAALAGSSTGPARKLTSTLPTDDEDFRVIVETFIRHLTEKREAMTTALAAADLDALASLAHWLKGTGGTAGFPDFTEPAKQLERLAREGRLTDIEAVLTLIHRIANRIVIE